MMPPRKAIILFGHGSRDPLWRRPIEAVAARLRASRPELSVRCAYLELDQPDLHAAVAELAAAGASQFTILPMFLGAGKHAREDLPAMVDALRAGYPGIRLDLRVPVGEDARVLDLLAAIAGE
jgi:sirohydrochlorin cobaltochelatase